MSLTDHPFFTELLSGLVLNSQQLKQIYFAQISRNRQDPALRKIAGVKFPRLEIVLRGSYTADKSAGTSVTLSNGDALFIPAFASSQPRWDKNVLLLSVLFAPSYIGFNFFDKRVATAGFHRLRTLEITQQNAEEIEHILQVLNALAARIADPDISRYLVLSLLHVCRNQLALPLVNKMQRGAFLYKSICTYVQDNFASTLNRENTAAMFNISANHLSRIFQQEGNMSFIDYLHWVRLGKARMILQKYHLSVNEVAYRCGYSDASYFCRLFKREFEVTPSEYRERFLST